MSIPHDFTRSTEIFSKRSLQEDKQEVKGQIKYGQHIYKLTWIKTRNDQEPDKLNEAFKKNIPIIKALKYKSLSLRVNSDGSIDRVYKSSKKPQIKLKKYSRKDLEQKLEKSKQKKPTEEVIKRIIGLSTFLASGTDKSQEETLTIDIFKSGVDELKREEKEISLHINHLLKQIESGENRIVELKKLTSKKPADKEINEELKKEEQNLRVLNKKANGFREQLMSLLLGDLILTQSIIKKNKYTKAGLEKDYLDVLNQLKTLHSSNITLVNKLNKLPSLSQSDIDRFGFCSAISQSFLLELPDNPTTSQFIETASKFTGGLTDKERLIEDILIKNFMVIGFELSSINQFLGDLSDAYYHEHIRNVGIKDTNVVIKNRGVKLKQISFQTDGQMNTTKVPEGKYYLQISSSKKGEEKDMAHAIVFVKNKDNSSYIFDPNFGLIFCNNDQDVQEKFELMKSVYKSAGNNSHFRISFAKLIKRAS